MFTSRNIHYALLGIILGATSGYIFAFYQVESSMPRTLPTSQNTQAGHPNVSNDQLVAMFKEALAKNPNNTELMTRYANFLFDLGKYSESVEWFQKVLAIQPTNVDVRTDLGTALWNAGEKDLGMAQYQQILKIDPKHMATLHNLVVVYMEQRDFANADRILKQMESIDPKYGGLDSLKKRLAEVQGK